MSNMTQALCVIGGGGKGRSHVIVTDSHPGERGGGWDVWSGILTLTWSLLTFS